MHKNIDQRVITSFYISALWSVGRYEGRKWESTRSDIVFVSTVVKLYSWPVHYGAIWLVCILDYNWF